jgi:hypothetical protein
MHLVGFITNKFVTMHGHRNVKKKDKLVFTNKLKEVTVTGGQTFVLLVGSIQEVERFLGKQNVTVRYGVLTAVILVAWTLPPTPTAQQIFCNTLCLCPR